HAVLRRAKHNPEKYPWLTQLLARRPFKVVAIALANKMARVAWALLASGGRYRAPRLTAAERELANGGWGWRRAVHELQGVIKTLMRNGRDRRSENPGSATRGKNACFWLGPISGSHQGPQPERLHSRGRIHGCTRTIRGNVRFFSLAPRAPSIHGTSRTLAHYISNDRY